MKNLSNWRVLIVEDEIDGHGVLTPILEHHNIAIESVFSAEDALDILQKIIPTVVIVDLALPGMNGWELLEEMQADPEWQNIPAVAMTAYHSTGVAQDAISAGFAAYFPKPINAQNFIEDLVDAVSSF